tara:strand:- start:7341 stop:9164 length:1824 start_codon:yes stop_codon:yes gene_type:complete
MSYWKNEELTSIKQTQVSIPSANGLSYNEHQRIDLHIPPNVKLFDGRNTYLNFDVKLQMPTGLKTTRLALDPVLGGNVLIKNIRIYGGNTLLEEVSEYNCKVNMEYWYDTDSTMRNLRAIKEGCLVGNPNNRSTSGSSESWLLDTLHNPYYTPRIATPDAVVYTNADDYLTAKCSLPLSTGIFQHSINAFPNFLFSDGLKIELDLEEAKKCIKQLDSVSRNRFNYQNPVFQSVAGGGAANWNADDSTTQTLHFERDNNMTSVANFPFVVGERVNFCDPDAPDTTSHLQNNVGLAYLLPTIEEIRWNTALAVPLIRVQFTDLMKNPAGATDIIGGEWIMYSASADTATGAPSNHVALTSYDASYEVSNVELVVQSLTLSPAEENKMNSDMRNEGAMELDIVSATNYKHTLLSGNTHATINLPLSNTRAKSMIIIPTDMSVYNSAQLVASRGTYEYTKRVGDGDVVDYNGKMCSFQSGYSGINDYLTDYQFNIDDKLVPSRPVDTSKSILGRGVSAQHLIEIEKGLNQSRIVPRSLRGFNYNFIIARAFALYDGVADLNNRTNQIQLRYNESVDADADARVPEKNKLFNCFVYHVRRIIVRGESVSVRL